MPCDLFEKHKDVLFDSFKLISEMEDRGRKRSKTVTQLRLVVGLFHWPNSLTESPIQLNNLQTHYMHLPR